MAVDFGTIAVSLGRIRSDIKDPQAAQWTMWIGDALLLIQDRLGDVGLLNQQKLDFVVRESVKAQILRFEDAMSSDDNGETAGRFAGRLIILPEWWTLLDTSPGDSAAFSYQPYFEADSTLYDALGWRAIQ